MERARNTLQISTEPCRGILPQGPTSELGLTPMLVLLAGLSTVSALQAPAYRDRAQRRVAHRPRLAS